MASECRQFVFCTRLHDDDTTMQTSTHRTDKRACDWRLDFHNANTHTHTLKYRSLCTWAHRAQYSYIAYIVIVKMAIDCFNIYLCRSGARAVCSVSGGGKSINPLVCVCGQVLSADANADSAGPARVECVVCVCVFLKGWIRVRAAFYCIRT